ncbi:MAG: energy transducer TonB [Candidatus Delongbacteria bacterium]|nr:energy transducer TonB [Candidatus Delongbacteria bacterium]
MKSLTHRLFQYGVAGIILFPFLLLQAQDDQELRDINDQALIDSLMKRDVRLKSVIEFHLFYMNLDLLREAIRFPALFTDYQVQTIRFNYQSQNFECCVNVTHERYMDLKSKSLGASIRSLQIITQRLRSLIERYFPRIRQPDYFIKIDFRHNPTGLSLDGNDENWKTFAVYQNGQVSFLVNPPPSLSSVSTRDYPEEGIQNQITFLEGKKQIDEARFKQELEYHTDELTRYYNLRLRRNSGLSGRVVLDVTLLPSGGIGDIRTNLSEIEDESFLTGLIDMIRQWQFEPTAGIVRFRFSLDFRIQS